MALLLVACGDAIDTGAQGATESPKAGHSAAATSTKADQAEPALEERDGVCQPDASSTDPDCFIRIGSWNVENFGVEKASKDRVMDRIAEVMSRFDVLAVQEIMNIHEKSDPGCPRNTGCPEAEKCGALRESLDSRLNDKLGGNFGFAFSPQVRHERYLFVYNRDRVELLDARLVEDPGDESEPTCAYRPDDTGALVRQPYLAAFRAGNFSFTLLNSHISTSETRSEIEALLEVEESVRDSGYSDVMVLGDLNADCDFLSEEKLQGIPDSEYMWLFNDTDTTLNDARCAYDRLLITKSTIEDFTGDLGAFREIDKRMSDHYPIWMNFHLDQDSDSHAGDLHLR